MNRLKTILAMIAMILSFSIVAFQECHYTRKGVVAAVGYDGITSIEDTAGNIWQIEDDRFEVGTKVTLHMHTNCTESIIEDDYVLFID